MFKRRDPWLVIDASGPFQGAGYRIPLAAVKAGAHIVDLTDARDYLADYVLALDAAARTAGIAALAGTRSTPTLSAAVVRELTDGWRRLDTLRLAITPGGRSAVGWAACSTCLVLASAALRRWKPSTRNCWRPGMPSPRGLNSKGGSNWPSNSAAWKVWRPCDAPVSPATLNRSPLCFWLRANSPA